MHSVEGMEEEFNIHLQDYNWHFRKIKTNRLAVKFASHTKKSRRQQ